MTVLDKKAAEAELGPAVNDRYVGRVHAAYLKVGDEILFFRGDGTRRGKIGLTPAAALKLGGTMTHAHRTFQVHGPEAELGVLAKRLLGVGLKEIQGAF